MTLALFAALVARVPDPTVSDVGPGRLVRVWLILVLSAVLFAVLAATAYAHRRR